MAPPGRKEKAAEAAVVEVVPEPALGRSTMVNVEGLSKVRPMTAATSNEWGATRIWLALCPTTELDATSAVLFLHTLFAGLLPPFSDFFNAVLSHYQVHALHLKPNSVLLLSAFAFLCEAFLGVTPSVVLFRHFFSLRLIMANQCSGCASFRIIDETVGDGIDMRLTKEAEGFRRQWVYVDAAQFSPLLHLPTSPAARSSGWGHERLADPRLARVCDDPQV
jgi:hypothetical protein